MFITVSSGNLILDAEGNTAAIFIFRAGTTITFAATQQVVLTGGAHANNVFWSAGTVFIAAAYSKLVGSVFAPSITFAFGSSLEGRALAYATTLTMDSTIVCIIPPNTHPPPTPKRPFRACRALTQNVFLRCGLVGLGGRRPCFFCCVISSPFLCSFPEFQQCYKHTHSFVPHLWTGDRILRIRAIMRTMPSWKIQSRCWKPCLYTMWRGEKLHRTRVHFVFGLQSVSSAFQMECNSQRYYIVPMQRWVRWQRASWYTAHIFGFFQLYIVRRRQVYRRCEHHWMYIVWPW